MSTQAIENLDGKVALVTGAGRGLGRTIAQALARQGARVACQDATPINLDETLASIREQGGYAQEYIFDLAKKMPVQAMIEQVVADLGSLDILVNDFRVKPRLSLIKMDEWDWHRTIDLNLGGPFFTMQSAARVMQDLGGGVIINLVVLPGSDIAESEYAAFHASMAGLIELTRQSARELEEYHIRLNGVASRFVDAEAGSQSEVLVAPGEVDCKLLEYRQRIVEAVLSLCARNADITPGDLIEVGAGEDRPD